MRLWRYQLAALPIFVLIVVFTTASADLGIRVFDGRGKQRDLESVVTDISSTRVVFIGENHDRYDQHLSELEIIRRLYERDPNRWVIGVEFIQAPFQSDLDAYIAGAVLEREFLKRTQYFDRWGYDFRLYSPIFRFANEHAIPMVALNADRELTQKVGKVGLEGLTAAQKANLPKQIDKSDDSYRKRIQKVFNEHPESTGGNFERFWEAQLVWDETMAERAAEYVSAHPDKAMVVLAGSGHIESGSGIPNRVRRRLPEIKTAVLITADKAQTKGNVADYFLISKKEVLPPAPKIGIGMEVNDGVRVKDISAGGSAAGSGIKPKDQIVSVDDQEVKTLGDVRLALLNKKVGDRLTIRVRRDNHPGAVEDLTFEIDLKLEGVK